MAHFHHPVRSSHARRRNASASALLGLSGGALGWAGLAEAAEGERSLQTLLLPEHYQILDDGMVVFALKTGEQMSLSEEQYVLLDGGLVLVVDELAQDAMAELPVMGSLRTQLLTEVEPVRNAEGNIVEVSSTQPLWSGEGPTPRLFEEVDLQTYELAQSNGQSAVDDVLALSMSVSPGAMVLLGMLMTSDQLEMTSDQLETPPQPHPYAGQTLKVDDIHPGADLFDGAYPGTLAYDVHALNGKLYFQGFDGSEGELYVYDPGTGQTAKVASADINNTINNSGSTSPSGMHALNGKLYFQGYDGYEGELYVYDPGTGITAKVASADVSGSGSNTSPYSLHALNGKLYFGGYEGSEGELYVYDPGTGTTAKVDDIHPGADLTNGGFGTDPSFMHALNGKLYFKGTADGSDYELYVYDPGTGTTAKVDDIHPGADLTNGGFGTNPSSIHALNGKLYFYGSNGSEGELYVYDPVTGQTAKVASADVSGSGSSSNPSYMHALNGKLYFTASADPGHGLQDGRQIELYVYDPGPVLGSGETTKVASADVNDASIFPDWGTWPLYIHSLDGALYFSGIVGSERELYVYFPDDLTV